MTKMGMNDETPWVRRMAQLTGRPCDRQRAAKEPTTDEPHARRLQSSNLPVC